MSDKVSKNRSKSYFFRISYSFLPIKIVFFLLNASVFSLVITIEELRLHSTSDYSNKHYARSVENNYLAISDNVDELNVYEMELTQVKPVGRQRCDPATSVCN